MTGNPTKNITQKILYIEDDAYNRKRGLAAIENRRLQGIIAPADLVECLKIIREKKFHAAIIDFKLSAWIDKNDPTKLDNVEIFDGVDIACYLNVHYPEMHIGIFSANQTDLERKLRTKQVTDKVKIVRQDNVPAYDIYRFIPDFIEGSLGVPVSTNEKDSDKNYHVLHVFVKALHKPEMIPPVNILTSLYKKILLTTNKGQRLWNAGEFVWAAGINEEVNLGLKEGEKLPVHLTLENPEEEYIIKIDKEKYLPRKLHIVSINQDINGFNLCNKANVSELITTISKDYILLTELFVARSAYYSFIERVATIPELIHILEPLSLSGKLECLKLLYKGLQTEKGFRIHFKEDIYAFLKDFPQPEFPFILDIFKGQVNKIEDNISFVKLESMSPEKPTRSEEFDTEILRDSGLEEDSLFEFTIYIPQISGQAYHFELI